MNASPRTRTTANACVGLAAFLYETRSQVMLVEISHDRKEQADHDAAFFLAAGVLAAMWPLLLTALPIATASGGFVAFSAVMPHIEHALRPDDTRR